VEQGSAVSGGEGLSALTDARRLELAQEKLMAMEPRAERIITIYRDDSTAQVRYPHAKTFFWTAGGTVLTIAVYESLTGSAHHYVHWPRERFCWFRDEPG
jgi:hypothetical protein